jgi:hypothetical protein
MAGSKGLMKTAREVQNSNPDGLSQEKFAVLGQEVSTDCCQYSFAHEMIRKRSVVCPFASLTKFTTGFWHSLTHVLQPCPVGEFSRTGRARGGVLRNAVLGSFAHRTLLGQNSKS